MNATFYRLPSSGVGAGAGSTRHRADFVLHGEDEPLRHARETTARPRSEHGALLRAGSSHSSSSTKLGPVLWQLPPTFTRDDVRLAEALAQLPPGRHASNSGTRAGSSPEVMALLREHGVALVIGDRPEVQPLPDPRADRGLDVRPVPRGTRGGAATTRSRSYASGRAAPLVAAREAFIYFNNDWEGFAPERAPAEGASRGLTPD